MAKKKPIKGKKKTKTKKSSQTKTISAMRGTSAPEYFLFGFILISALLFSISSLLGAKNIRTSFSMTDVSMDKKVFQKKINNLVQGYPIERMAPYISQKNKRVASFLVAIAKKESNWGRHAPRMAGRECYNYWGYRGPENPTPSGYSCFDSPRHAVDVVGGRLAELVAEKIDTPKEMVMWKCGTTNCAGRDRGAAKWVWDVGYYYKQIYSSTKKNSPKKEITMLH
ncbi:MAG TPA: hypothetical protein VK254_02230 [Candidatus Bathyarchaeia archaeon]|nr:hypothetical protein [Candidatus Bathyarchaeia archaeon]